MKLKIFPLISVVILFAAELIHAQGKIVFLNGKEKRFQSAELKGDYVVFKPDSFSRPRRADKFDVFAIKKDNGTEELIYLPDTLSHDDPTVAEVRDYIRGEQFAKQVYKKPLNLIAGIAVGAASSYATIYGLGGPLIYATIVGRFTPKIKEPVAITYDEQTGIFTSQRTSESVTATPLSESFTAGYGKKARNIKVKNSLIGGGIGFAVGVTALVLIFGND